MKRVAVLLLVLVMVMSLTLAGCQKPATPTTPATEEPGTAEAPATQEATQEPVSNQLIIGTNTEPSGDFSTPYWQNNATDNDVNTLMAGYSTYDMTLAGEIVLNDTAVEKVEVKDIDGVGREYKYTLKDGLVFSDGSPITAMDYVAGVLFFSAPQLTELEAKPTAGMYYAGYSAFNAGETEKFTGVRLYDEKTFSVVLDKQYVPYFFETAYASVGPMKLAYWMGTDKITVKDDGDGAYFSEKWASADYKDAITKARTDVNRVVSGAYKPVSFDQASKTTVIEINDKFLGNYEGKKPAIQTLIFKYVDSKTAMDQFKTGEVDLLTGMASGAEINAGLDVVDQEAGKFDYITYPRSGFGKIQFVADLYPTKDVEVRQAIAHLLDRNDFAKTFTGGYGGVVNGPYGEGQWYYAKSKAELNNVLNSYPYSYADAVALLDKAGWNKDANGGAYVEGQGLRHKEVDGKLIPLELKWSSSGNEVAELLTIKLVENPDLAKAGMKITEDVMDFTTLLNYLYRDGSQDAKFAVPTYNMFNLGSGFPATYLPDTEYTIDEKMLAEGYNTNFIIDPELDKLAKQLGKVDPSDEATFLKNYVAYITHWNKVLPDLPLYSNLYHDFFNAKLSGFEHNAISGLPVALTYAEIK